MDHATKQTALFFGFLAAAMAQVSAHQATAASSDATPQATHRSIETGDLRAPVRPAAGAASDKARTRPNS